MKRSFTALLVMLSMLMFAPSGLKAAALEQQLPTENQWESIPAQFTMSESQPGNNNNNVQVFDVAKGKVVHSVPNSPQIQQTAEEWLGQITSLAPEIQPDMKATYIVRVPIEPAKPLNVGQVMLNVKEIFVFHYADKSKEPLLLAFDENKKPFFFHIKMDITPFITSLNIPD